MKRVYVNEQWCLGCHLCEVNCAHANSGISDMIRALKDKAWYPRIRVEGDNIASLPVNCRHCTDPLCIKSCISGALHRENGVVMIDKSKCVGCLTCILVCPFGAVSEGADGLAQKCELCQKNGTPACVKGCPNHAIVYEER